MHKLLDLTLTQIETFSLPEKTKDDIEEEISNCETEAADKYFPQVTSLSALIAQISKSEDTRPRSNSDESDKSWDKSMTKAVWQNNKEATECHQCHQKFGVFVRKHHCRSCGKIFCNDCSKKKVALPGLPGQIQKPQRVCNICAFTVANEQPIVN